MENCKGFQHQQRGFIWYDLFIQDRVKQLDELIQMIPDTQYTPLFKKEEERLLSLMQELSIFERRLRNEDTDLRTSETTESG